MFVTHEIKYIPTGNYETSTNSSKLPNSELNVKGAISTAATLAEVASTIRKA